MTERFLIAEKKSVLTGSRSNRWAPTPWSPEGISRHQEWRKLRTQVRVFQLERHDAQVTTGIIYKDWNTGFLSIPEFSSQEFILFFVFSFFTGNLKAFWGILPSLIGSSGTLGMPLNLSGLLFKIQNPSSSRSTIKWNKANNDSTASKVGARVQRMPGAYVAPPHPTATPMPGPHSLKSNDQISHTLRLYVFKSS